MESLGIWLGEGFRGMRAPSEMSRDTGAQERGFGVQKLQKGVLGVQNPGQEASTYGSPWRGHLGVREAQARGSRSLGTPEEGYEGTGAPGEEFGVLEPTARSFGGGGSPQSRERWGGTFRPRRP